MNDCSSSHGGSRARSPAWRAPPMETEAAAAQVLVSASELSRHSEYLSTEVGRFLATVRAA